MREMHKTRLEHASQVPRSAEGVNVRCTVTELLMRPSTQRPRRRRLGSASFQTHPDARPALPIPAVRTSDGRPEGRPSRTRLPPPETAQDEDVLALAVRALWPRDHRRRVGTVSLRRAHEPLKPQRRSSTRTPRWAAIRNPGRAGHSIPIRGKRPSLRRCRDPALERRDDSSRQSVLCSG